MPETLSEKKQKPYLIYTLVTFDVTHYLAMFRLFVRSLVRFSRLDEIDLAIVCPPEVREAVLRLARREPGFPDVSFVEAAPSPDLFHALLGKFDVVALPNVRRYQKVMYLDCDVLVQGDLQRLLDRLDVAPDVLYAPAEGDLEGEYWYLDAYRARELADLRRRGVRSFNSGTMVFAPTTAMLAHFRRAKRLALEYDGQRHFYDQSFFNYYFNTRARTDTAQLSRSVVIFPDPDKAYDPRTKLVLHFAGIGHYRRKARIMRRYLAALEARRGVVSSSSPTAKVSKARRG